MKRRRVRHSPIVINLNLGTLQNDHGLYDFFAVETKWTRHQVKELQARFALYPDERSFARTLLARKPHYWVFRSNQRRFCGDFIVVDMSSPAIEKRKVFVIEMKRNVPLKLGGGGAGIQFKNAARAVRIIAEQTGKIRPDAAYELIVGNRRHLLDYLGIEEAPVSSVRTRSSYETAHTAIAGIRRETG